MGDDSVFFFSFFFFLVGVVLAVFLSIEQMDSVLSLEYQWAQRNLKVKWTKVLRQMGSIIFH